MKKLLISLPLLLSFTQISSVLANSMDVPYDCGLEPSTFSEHNPENISNLIDAGSVIYQNEASYLDWANLFYALSTIKSSSTMSTEGPDYVLQGVPTRFKYDGNWFDWTSRWFTVRFGTSEFGSEVEKTSDWDNNAYTNLTFHYTYGPGLVWSRGDGCMAKSVIVQKKPSVNLVSLTGGNEISVTVQPTVDQYSKIEVENIGTPPKIFYTFFNESDGITKNIGSNSTTMTYTPSHNGPIRVTVRAFDGTYYSNREVMGEVMYTGKSYCTDCGPIL
tara:strand:- start:6631 stop:7455 length:825 start_codon:yes stop_codon:yes gene_type:complete